MTGARARSVVSSSSLAQPAVHAVASAKQETSTRAIEASLLGSSPRARLGDQHVNLGARGGTCSATPRPKAAGGGQVPPRSRPKRLHARPKAWRDLLRNAKAEGRWRRPSPSSFTTEATARLAEGLEGLAPQRQGRRPLAAAKSLLVHDRSDCTLGRRPGGTCSATPRPKAAGGGQVPPRSRPKRLHAWPK